MSSSRGWHDMLPAQEVTMRRSVVYVIGTAVAVAGLAALASWLSKNRR